MLWPIDHRLVIKLEFWRTLYLTENSVAYTVKVLILLSS